MRKAFSYIRFSTPDQAKGDSFRRQTEFSQKYAEKYGLILDETTSLRDLGVSAFRGSNVKEGALAGFLELVRQGRVPKGSVLIVESLDRLSRDQIRPALQLFLGILDGGVSIVTLHPEREYTPNDQDPLVLIEPLIYFSRAHEESATKSRRVGESWENRRKRASTEQTAMTTVGPKWLRSENGKFVEIPERSQLVRDIFRWTLEGLGTYAITKKLTNDKVEGWGPKGKWNAAYVRLILTDRRVLGEYQPKKLVQGKMQNQGEVIANYYPRLVSDKDYYEAVGTIKKRKRRGGRGGGKHENILSGLVFNAEDGSKMYYSMESKVPTLASTAAYYGKARPKGNSFSYSYIEQAVLTVLTELQIPSGWDSAEENRVLELEGRLCDLREKIAKAVERSPSVEDFDALLDTIARLEQEKKEVQMEYEAAKKQAAKRDPLPTPEGHSVIAARAGLSPAARQAQNVILRQKIGDLVESIWILIENRTRVEKTAHVQVYLKNKQREHQVVYYPTPPSEAVEPLVDYSDRDFRAESRAKTE